MKIGIVVVCLVMILGVSGWLARYSSGISSYEGLPTVPCQDDTREYVEYYEVRIKVVINGKNYPLDPAIGHDYGKCLHDIYVDDDSGLVHVKANKKDNFTLGEFFDVWKKTFSKDQIMEYRVTPGHTLEVSVDGKKVDTDRNTPLVPGEEIEIVYQ